MPDADVVLTGISLAYYMEGRLLQRLPKKLFCLHASAATKKSGWWVLVWLR